MFIALAVIVAYWSGAIFFARQSYAKNRPSRVPVCGKKNHNGTVVPHGEGGRKTIHIAAGYSGSADREHRFRDNLDGEIPSCYGPKSEKNAVGLAILTGMLWPILVPIGVCVALVIAGHKDRPAEKRYKTEERLAQRKADLAAAESELDRVTDDIEAIRSGRREYF